MSIIYLDGHATTPLAPEAEAAMVPWWNEKAANPHSPHLRGMLASQAVEAARSSIADAINTGPSEVFFTSGATEANNISIRGLAAAATASGNKRSKIVVSAIEHKSVLESAKSLAGAGFEIVEAPVDAFGVIDMESLSGALDERTLLVSVMLVNNEVGSIQPISMIVEAARRVGALVHVDAAQALGKVALDLSDVDLASLSAHKAYGPMGIGALVVSSASPLRPLPTMFGGSQEGGFRPGTVPTPLAVGFGKAAEVAIANLEATSAHSTHLAERFLRELSKRQVKYYENVPAVSRVSGSLSLRFPSVDASSLIGRVSRTIAISEGSACTSGQIQQSHVLKAMGKSDLASSETVRLFFGRFNTLEDTEAAAVAIAEALRD